MNANRSFAYRKSQAGQTIIIAMMVLGVLLILGFVFIGMISRNIANVGRQQARSAANDLAEAGIRYAHEQMLKSQQGADWRGTPTSLYAATDTTFSNPFTRDPDALYLRPAARDGSGNPLLVPGSAVQRDLGGPDGLGSYFRVNFNNGRVLLRIRYAPSDGAIFAANQIGPLRDPAKVRNYTIIEAVGRPGLINLTDPTTLNTAAPVQFDQFGGQVAFEAALSTLRAADAKIVSSRNLRAFVSIGIIESARYITNKYNVSSPAHLGFPTAAGVAYNGVNVGTVVPLQLGGQMTLLNSGVTPTPTVAQLEAGGSLYSNAALQISGKLVANLNRGLGDQIDVADLISGDDQATVTLNLRDRTNGVWGPLSTAILTATGVGGTAAFDSRSDLFQTISGTFRDGVQRVDPSGFPRSVGRKVAPSILTTDSDTGENRYARLTKDSGIQVGSGYDGRFGYGNGTYIDNTGDRQIPVDEQGRINVGAQQSLVDDWLNPVPKRIGDRSNWQGPYYIPPGAYVQLVPDGYIIARNQSGPASERTWKRPDGSDSGTSIIRYRLGRVNGVTRIINSITSPDINAASPDFTVGKVFNGVIFAEGNVRVRGTIPTDVQLSIVSMGTIYIEGSILKGVTGNGLQDPTEGVAIGARLTRPSKSTVMLMAKDYVTLNTTMFFGPASGTTVVPDPNGATGTGFWGLIVRVANEYRSIFDVALNPEAPGANPLNPSSWRPYPADYTNGTPINTKVLMTHAVAAGAQSPVSFFTMNVNFGAFDAPSGPAVSSYQFPVWMYPYGGNPFYYNTAANFYNLGQPFPATQLPVYGLGAESWQGYPKFESVAFDLLSPTQMNVQADRMVSTATFGSFSVLNQSTNDLTWRTTSIGGQATNDYILGRVAVVPHDLVVEASMFAEEGSFFVIPGNWANPNPNDRRDAYDATVQSYVNNGLAAADARNAANQDRFRAYGSSPDMPFYGEPLDVRIRIIGSVSENMPPPMSVQAEWLKKWGWIPTEQGAGGPVPLAHAGYPAQTYGPPASQTVYPNLIFAHDPVLLTGLAGGFAANNNPANAVRTDSYGRTLPPMPCLPVSPQLAYFGEAQ